MEIMVNLTRRLIVTFTLLITCTAAATPDYPALRTRIDPYLQQGLRQSLDRLGLMPAVNAKRLCVTLVDITDMAHPRVAAVNGDEMVYAASLPKIAILLGAFVKIERGEMSLDAETRQALTNMIRNSSNRDATDMLRRVGKADLAEILQSDRFRLYDPAVNGGLWVGKEYGKSPAWKRDPLHNLSHGATALQTARFYYMLETGRLVSDELGGEMKEILSKPAIHHKFVKGLMQSRPGAKIYRKSGSWKRWHADSAIIESGNHKYIAVALAEHPKGGQWLSQLIVPMDDLVTRTRISFGGGRLQ